MLKSERNVDECGVQTSKVCSLLSVLIFAAAKAVGPRMQASESVPFLSKPKRLDSSLPGYVGFDPLGLSDYVDVKWLQEGEIKNGRVAMLGVVGLIVPEVFTFPFFKKGVAVYDNFFQVLITMATTFILANPD